MIKKKAFGGTTAPLYETTSPSGKKIIFTVADLVQGGGKLKDPDGDGDHASFKPKKSKPYSLADKINKPDYGKKK